MYIGSSHGLERYLVPPTGVRCHFIPMAAPTSPAGLLLLFLATLRSIIAIARARPRVTFATGGYVSTPVTIASWLLRVPTVLFLPDVVPGRAVERLAPIARRIAVSTEDACQYLPPAKTVVTGYPVRDVFRAADRARGRRHFAIPEDALVLCVFGGSQGSRSINTALATHLRTLLTRCHVIHICGEQRHRETLSAVGILPQADRARYHLYPYLHGDDMAAALAAADLVVCRSGASTLGELPAMGKPAILVPLPEATVHQRENADYLVRHGAAVVLDDDALAARLGEVVLELLEDPARLARMAGAGRRLDHPNAARQIAELILDVAA